MKLRPRVTRRTRTARLLSDLVTLALLLLGLLAAVPPDRRDYGRVAFVTALLFTVIMTRRLIGPGSRPPVAPRPPREPPAAGADYLTRLARLTGSLEAGSSSRAKFDLTVRPLLYRVAAERLRTRHGLDLRHDAAAARARLGDDLWQLFADTAPPAYDDPAPSLDEVQRWITAVERI